MSDSGTDVLVVPDQAPAGRAPQVIHIVCECDTDYGLCGEDVSNRPFRDRAADEDVCVVCADLDAFACERCGL